MGAGSFAVNTAFGAKDNVSPVFNKMTTGASKFENRLSRLNAQAQGFGSCISGMVKKIGAVMGGVFAFKAVKEKINEATTAAEREIEAQEKLTQVLKNNAAIRARGANEHLKVSKELFELASNIQKKGIIGDEVLVGGMQALGSMGFDDRVIKKIIPLIADLAVQQKGYNVTIQDTETLAKGLGRALAGNTGYLSRMGIVLDKNQTKTLKNMNTMQRANFIYNLLSKRVGGLNEKLAQTGRGIKIQFLNNLGDRFEDIGKRIIPIEGRFYKILNDQMPTFISIIDRFFNGIEYGLRTVEPLGVKFNALFEYLGQIILPKMSSAVPGIKTLFENILIPSIGFLIDGVGSLTKILVGAFGTISSICSFVGNNFIPIITSLATLLGGVLLYNINSVAWGLLGVYIKVQTLSGALIANTVQIWKNVAALIAQTGAFLASPIGWITGLIAALVLVVGLLWKNWDKVTTALTNLWNTAKPILDNFLLKCQEVFGNIGLFIKNNFINILLGALGPIGLIIQGIRQVSTLFGEIGNKKNLQNNATLLDYRNVNQNTSDNNTKYYSSNMSGALEITTKIENNTPYKTSSSVGIIKDNNLNLSPKK